MNGRCSKKRNPAGDGGLRIPRHHGRITSKSKLPDAQVPQPWRAIPNSQPLKSEPDHQRDCSLAGPAPSIISRELSRGRGRRGNLARQACRKDFECAQHCRKAWRLDAKVWAYVDFCLGSQWSPVQIASQQRVSREIMYQYV